MIKTYVLKNFLKIFLCILATGALFWVLFVHFEYQTLLQKNTPFEIEGVIISGQKIIKVGIADTPNEQQNGLSNTAFLPENTGMLFIFDTPNKYGFWMKDMNYGLDLLWLDKDMSIVAITENVTPDTYPNVFYPPVPVSYVLEINSFEASKIGFSTGLKLYLQSN